MKFLRIFVAAFSFAISCAHGADQAPLARANPESTTFSVDVSGLWWNPSESGWGMNVVQQSQTLFVTLFVYGSNGTPTWLVGPATTYTSVDSSGAFIFSGALYSTTGPWFGSPVFNPSAVTVTQVGTITIRFPTYASAQVTYSVNGVTVVKNVVPQTWLVNNLNGTYVGGTYGASASCGLPVQSTGALIAFAISTVGNTATIALTDVQQNKCILIGTITQTGKLSQVDGNYTCSFGTAGQFSIKRLEAGVDGLSGAYYTLSGTGCSAAIATIGAARVSF
jgi:hypothetical protein